MAYRVSVDFLDRLHRIGAKEGKEYGAPPAKKLSMTLRPTFIAGRGKTLVWGDWSNIEARVLPWLADSRGAEAKLDIFRAVDADKSEPDVYIRTAADLLGLDARELWADHLKGGEYAGKVRQSHGKVPELSLGFGGGLGALLAMGANYGVYIDEKQGLEMIARWREANAWARTFWGEHGRNGSYGLWGAINTAIENPDTIVPAGRVAYVYDRSYLKGTVFCALPCGRLLTYPAIKWEWREVEDKKTKKLVDRYQLTYLKGYGRTAAWYGKLAENITQAGAASVLRRTLKRLDPDQSNWMRSDFVRGMLVDPHFMPVVMHTHDEAVTETDEERRDEAALVLHRSMITNDEWDEGLPLAAEIASGWFYSKAADEINIEALKQAA